MTSSPGFHSAATARDRANVRVVMFAPNTMHPSSAVPTRSAPARRARRARGAAPRPFSAAGAGRRAGGEAPAVVGVALDVIRRDGVDDRLRHLGARGPVEERGVATEGRELVAD